MFNLTIKSERTLMLAALGAVVLGVAALIGGWIAMKDEVYAAVQLPYLLSGGIGGLFLLGVGVMAVRTAEASRFDRRLVDLEDRIEGLGDQLTSVLALLDGAVIETYEEEGRRAPARG